MGGGGGGAMPQRCGSPPMIPNANATTEAMGVATYTCLDGYDIQGEVSNLICAFGSWVGDLPNCTLSEAVEDEPSEFPLWLTITLPTVLLLTAAIVTCCCVIICCFGKKRDDEEDDEDNRRVANRNRSTCCFTNKICPPSVQNISVISLKPRRRNDTSQAPASTMLIQDA